MDNYSHDSLQVVFAILWPAIQQWMKTTAHPWFSWITEDTKRLNAFLSPLVAFLATAGFHFTVMGSSSAGWHFEFIIPPVLALQHVAGQWIAQHFEYVLMIKQPLLLKAILEAVKTQGGGQAAVGGFGSDAVGAKLAAEHQADQAGK